MSNMIEGSLAISGLFTAFLVAYWTMKAYESEAKEAIIPATIEHVPFKKAA